MTGVRHQSRHGSARRARGSIILPAAVAILVSLFLLASADVGYLFYLKRELQKSADLAAVAGAQRIGTDGLAADCSPLPGASVNQNFVFQAVDDIARRNMASAGTEVRMTTVRCGSWTSPPQRPPEELADLDVSAPQNWRFERSALTNAVWVRLDLRAPRLMPFSPMSRDIMAHAVATQDSPVAAFSVGSRLLDIGDSALSTVLSAVGVDVSQAGILNYGGLVDATLTPGGLLQQLGVPVTADLTVGSLNELLAARQVAIGDILNATLRAAGQDSLLSANAQLLRAINARIPAVTDVTPIVLGSTDAVRGVFAQILGPQRDLAAPALNATVSALDVVSAALGVATAGHAVDVRNVSLTIPGLLNNAVAVRTSIVEPPVVAVERVVGAPLQATARAHTAQIRMGIDICLGGDCGGLLSGLLGLLGTQIKLPITLELANASAQLQDVQCTPEPLAKIRVESSATQICVGRIDPALRFSSQQSCDVNLQPETLVSVAGLLRVRDVIHLNVLPSPGTTVADGGRRVSPATGPSDGWMRVGDVWRTETDIHLPEAVSQLTQELVRVVGQILTGGGARTDLPVAETEAAAASMTRYYIGGAGSKYSVPTMSLGLLGPGGAYDVGVIAKRIQAEHDSSHKECLLGIPLLCWTTNSWDGWAQRTAHFALGLLPSGACVGRTGLGATASDVVRFNQCVERELNAQLRAPVESGTPSWLSLVAAPALGLVEAVLQPLEPVLNAAISQVLGLDLREADVSLVSLSCHNARLVY